MPTIHYDVFVSDDCTEWKLNGRLHRIGAPAVEFANGSKYWLIDGLLHREDGPALERTDGYVEYWLRGRKVTEKDVMLPVMHFDVNQMEKLLKCKIKIV